MSYTFSFVILHYETHQDTIECADSILTNVEGNNYQIIIVDNGSKNNSAEILGKHYKDNSTVTLIVNKENLGFAKGNNIGFSFAKNDLKSDFIALINNDTIIKQNDFVTKIIQRYKSSIYHILGPDIISLVDNRHQNPSPITIQDKATLRKLIQGYKIQLFLNYLYIDKLLMTLKKSVVKKPFIKQNILPIQNEENKEMINVKLHGSCLIFSPKYMIILTNTQKR